MYKSNEKVFNKIRMINKNIIILSEIFELSNKIYVLEVIIFRKKNLI
jgi:hypothetical protein